MKGCVVMHDFLGPSGNFVAAFALIWVGLEGLSFLFKKVKEILAGKNE